MNVWPLLHRELLVGSRRRSTRWLRVGVAAAAILFGAMYIISMSAVGGASVGMLGSALFKILVSMAFAVTGLFGVFFAADAVSSERREGTLGLLFLTRLRGRDVVLGKLASTSLRSAYALMAGLPVMALPILLGGVTFKAYGYAALVLGNTLFLSVSAGLMVSSFNHKPTRAVMGTLLLVLSIAALPLLGDGIYSESTGQDWAPIASQLSPAYSLSASLGGASSSFLWGVLIQHFVGWLFLSIAARRTAQFTEKNRQPAKVRAVRWWVAPRESEATRQLRGNRPIQWLISHRSRGPTILALVTLALAGIIMAWGAATDAGGKWGAVPMPIAMFGISAIQAIFSFVILVWLTIESTRQTGDARKSGAFELLLSTPLTTPELVTGIFRGIWRIFAVAIYSLFLLRIAASWFSISYSYEILITSNNGGPFGTQGLLWQQIIAAGFSLVSVFATSIAVIEIGMWNGLRSDQTTSAAAKTFVLVVVLPSVVLSFALGIVFMIIQFLGPGSAAMWMSSVFQGMAALLVNLGFIFWARRKLFHHFREAANGTLTRTRKKKRDIGPPVPPPLPLPSS